MPVALTTTLSPLDTDMDSVIPVKNVAPLFKQAGTVWPPYSPVVSDSSGPTLGQLSATGLNFGPGDSQATVYATPLNFLAIPYNVLDKDLPVDPSHPEWAPAIARKVPEYSAFPAYRYCRVDATHLMPCTTNIYSVQPTASVRIFTSYKNPVSTGPDLVPLYRMSVVCRDYGIQGCSTNPYHISHVYATDTNEVFSTLPGSGYRLDGIEGYIYSKALPQPVGTVRLCRKYSAARGDYVLFPGAGGAGYDCTASSFEGGTYDQGETYLGYVHSVTSDGSDYARPFANIQTALFRNATSPPVSQFILDFDFNGSADNAVNWGAGGDKGLVADMNNDKRADFVRYAGGTWYVDLERDGGIPNYTYYFGGDPADQPLIGYLHSASLTTPDLAVYRNGIWYITYGPLINNGVGPVNLTCIFGGVAGDVPLVGDFNHDGIDDLVIYRNGWWFVHFMPNCATGTADLTLAIGGAPGDIPLAVDWDRDGTADLVIFRAGIWYVSTRRNSYAQAVYAFGAAGDKPLVGRFNQ